MTIGESGYPKQEKECPVETSEVTNMAHESANQVALEAARRMDIEKNPAETYRETYEKVYDFLVLKHKEN